MRPRVFSPPPRECASRARARPDAVHDADGPRVFPKFVGAARVHISLKRVRVGHRARANIQRRDRAPARAVRVARDGSVERESYPSKTSPHALDDALIALYARTLAERAAQNAAYIYPKRAARARSS